MKFFQLSIAFKNITNILDTKLLFCHLIKKPRDTIQSFSLVAATNTDMLKSDDLHEKWDVDVNDKQESFWNAFRRNSWNLDMSCKR